MRIPWTLGYVDEVIDNCSDSTFVNGVTITIYHYNDGYPTTFFSLIYAVVKKRLK